MTWILIAIVGGNIVMHTAISADQCAAVAKTIHMLQARPASTAYCVSPMGRKTFAVTCETKNATASNCATN